MSTVPYTFDTTLFATDAGGLPGVSAGTGASLKFYLYDELLGKPPRAAKGEVCFPCSFDPTRKAPKLSVPLDNLMEAAGGFSESAGLSASALV